MLKQRVITAVLLLLVLLPALAAQAAWPFGLLTLVMIGAAGWEWARLNGRSGAGSVSSGLMLAFVSMAAGLTGMVVPPWMWWAAVLLWVLGGTAVLRLGVPAWPQLPPGWRQLGGLLMLWLAWLAIWTAHGRGLNFLLSLFCLVWAADIAAYFGGKAFGRRKLALSISPGKSWEGAFSGMLGVLVVAGLWMYLDTRLPVDGPSLYTVLWQRWGGALAVLCCLFLASMSVVGDLFESLVKRAAGVKDSSGLLPGHGGVLDRIDALLPVCPLALALIQ
ncbi:phosphatidate cytidylyltransferase [Sphaerotilus hippei]|uniref:Phosphatidate cytidylyltransferase n=1 Tax=Sphaerotilus hippei TaxID=744406 RepID=A0A318H4I2_9BURK|nr:phosphatidate cytidylyltransferase [Sphaerotilus hippei]PXW98651.1 phosphatidate cytidylyltransferase [Sphaerotilus hippei]